jgi:hypothetical protein
MCNVESFTLAIAVLSPNYIVYLLKYKDYISGIQCVQKTKEPVKKMGSRKLGKDLPIHFHVFNLYKYITNNTAYSIFK